MALPADFLPVDDTPTALRPALEKAWQRLSESLARADNVAEMTGQEPPSENWLALGTERRRQLARVITISDFALYTLVRYPEWLLHLDAGG